MSWSICVAREPMAFMIPDFCVSSLLFSTSKMASLVFAKRATAFWRLLFGNHTMFWFCVGKRGPWLCDSRDLGDNSARVGPCVATLKGVGRGKYEEAIRGSHQGLSGGGQSSR